MQSLTPGTDQTQQDPFTPSVAASTAVASTPEQTPQTARSLESAFEQARDAPTIGRSASSRSATAAAEEIAYLNREIGGLERSLAELRDAGRSGDELQDALRVLKARKHAIEHGEDTGEVREDMLRRVSEEREQLERERDERERKKRQKDEQKQREEKEAQEQAEQEKFRKMKEEQKYKLMISSLKIPSLSKMSPPKL